MLKEILNSIEGSRTLNRNEMKIIFGGDNGDGDGTCQGMATIVCNSVLGPGGTGQATHYPGYPMTWSEAVSYASICTNGWKSIWIAGC